MSVYFLYLSLVFLLFLKKNMFRLVFEVEWNESFNWFCWLCYLLLYFFVFNFYHLILMDWLMHLLSNITLRFLCHFLFNSFIFYRHTLYCFFGEAMNITVRLLIFVTFSIYLYCYISHSINSHKMLFMCCQPHQLQSFDLLVYQYFFVMIYVQRKHDFYFFAFF